MSQDFLLKLLCITSLFYMPRSNSLLWSSILSHGYKAHLQHQQKSAATEQSHPGDKGICPRVFKYINFPSKRNLTCSIKKSGAIMLFLHTLGDSFLLHLIPHSS